MLEVNKRKTSCGYQRDWVTVVARVRSGKSLGHGFCMSVFSCQRRTKGSGCCDGYLGEQIYRAGRATYLSSQREIGQMEQVRILSNSFVKSFFLLFSYLDLLVFGFFFFFLGVGSKKASRKYKMKIDMISCFPPLEC